MAFPDAWAHGLAWERDDEERAASKPTDAPAATNSSTHRAEALDPLRRFDARAAISRNTLTTVADRMQSRLR